MSEQRISLQIKGDLQSDKLGNCPRRQKSKHMCNYSTKCVLASKGGQHLPPPYIPGAPPNISLSPITSSLPGRHKRTYRHTHLHTRQSHTHTVLQKVTRHVQFHIHSSMCAVLCMHNYMHTVTLPHTQPQRSQVPNSWRWGGAAHQTPREGRCAHT